MDALVTNGSSRVAYTALRSLSTLGLRVAVADTGSLGMSQWSKFCRRKYTYADPFMLPESFIEDLNRILRDSNANFLLPVMLETEVLAKYRDRLPDGVILPIASYEKIRTVNDKHVMASLAKNIGVNVPEVIIWHDWDELEDKLKGSNSPLVVKLRRGHEAMGIYYPADTKETLALCRDLAARYSLGPDKMPIVQRRVGGEKWMVSCLYYEGRKITSFTQKTLRQKPATGGVSTLRVSMRNNLLEAYAEKMLDSLSWHGIASVEFKYDGETGEGWFIEINPRLWTSIGNAPAAGVDLVALLYIASTEGLDKALGMVRPQRLGVVSRWWLGDAALAFSEARRLSWFSSLKLLLPGGADVYDEFSMDDLSASAGLFAGHLSHHINADKKPHELKRWELD